VKRFTLLLLPVLFISCATLFQTKNQTIRIKGSDTMRPLVQLWAEDYMERNERIAVYVDGGGTATGAQALAMGQVDLCMASRPLRADELQVLAQNFNTVGVSVLVAKDALSIFLHPDNPVSELSLDEIQQIFLSNISKWNQVGGDDARIDVVTRTPNSGTFIYFQEHVLNGEGYRDDRLTLPTLRKVLEHIETNPNAIGYGGRTLEQGIKFCTVNGIESTMENIANDSYPIIRYLYLYAVDTPQGHLKKFTDWVLEKRAQELVDQAGFYSIWK